MKINKNFKIILSVLILIGLVVSAALIFKPKERVTTDKKRDSRINSSSSKISDGITTIDLSESKIANSGITAIKLVPKLHRAQLIAYGSVISVKELANDVRNFTSGKARLAKAEENLLISQKNFERTKSLFESKLASEQDFQSSQAAFLSDRADVNSARSDLNSLKSSITEQWGNGISQLIFSGISPQGNYSEELQRILSIEDKLVQVSLPNQEAGIKFPYKIYVQSVSGSPVKILCRFVSTAYRANLQFQTSTLYYLTSDASLNAGMNVKVFFPVGEKLKGVFVPASSVIWYQGKAWVYVEMSSNKFTRVEINTDDQSGADYFIPANSGVINPGVTVVKDGAQLLLSEELKPQPGAKTGGDGGDND